MLSSILLISVVACAQSAPLEAGRELCRGNLTGFGPLAFSPGGKWLANAAMDGTIDVWDWKKRRRVMNLSPPTLRVRLRPKVVAVAYRRDGRRLMSVERSRINEEDGGERPEECSIRTWNLENQKCENQVIFVARDTERLTLSPNGRLLARADGHQVRLIDTATGVLRTKFDLRVGGRPEEPFDVFLWPSFSPDSSRLIVIGGHWVEEQLVGDLSSQIWDIAKHSKIADFVVAHGNYSPPALSPDGRYLALGDFNGRIDVYDISQGKLHATLLPKFKSPITSVEFTPDSNHLLTGVCRSDVHIWKIPGGELVSRIPVGDTEVLCLSPDGKTLANGSSEYSSLNDQGVELWEINTLIP